jgi:hypothetical protein
MGSVTTEFGSPVRATYFTEVLPGSNATRLAAVAVWRVAPGSRPRGWRELLRRIRHRLGPMGAGFVGFHLRGTDVAWSGSAGERGEQETLYHSERCVVRVLGREYALPPDGRTLVLLIDERSSTGAPSVTVRTLSVPTMLRPPVDMRADPATLEQQKAEAAGQEHAAWAAALRADPEVRAFMAERDDDSGAW